MRLHFEFLEHRHTKVVGNCHPAFLLKTRTHFILSVPTQCPDWMTTKPGSPKYFFRIYVLACWKLSSGSTSVPAQDSGSFHPISSNSMPRLDDNQTKVLEILFKDTNTNTKFQIPAFLFKTRAHFIQSVPIQCPDWMTTKPRYRIYFSRIQTPTTGVPNHLGC